MDKMISLHRLRTLQHKMNLKIQSYVKAMTKKKKARYLQNWEGHKIEEKIHIKE